MVRRALAPAAVVAAVLLVASCARNPVTGRRQLSLISEEQEIALGKQAAQEIVQTMGAYPDPEVQRYVEGIGMRMAKASERPNLPWSFTVLDDPMVNAFALPGGPIFVTRGILSHLNSEAELATVLGHEIGHVTAKHSVDQISRAQVAQLGLGVGQIFSETLRGAAGQAAGAGLQLMFLRFGRDAERQSDALGYRYMVEQGYDPREMADVFATLERASGAAGAGRIPAWLSTHPDPGDRAETARRRAQEVPDADKRRVGREPYMQRLAGMTVGDDPRQGYFRGNAFLHPGLRFQVRFPEGWQAQNTPSAVAALAPGKDGAVQLTVAGKVTPEDAIKKFFGQEGVQAVDAGQGLPGAARYFQAQTEQGVLRGIVSFVTAGEATLQLVGFAPAERLQAHDPAFRAVLSSFGPLTDPAALNVQPARIEIVKVPRDMTIEEFAQQFPSSAPPERLAILNGIEKGERLRAGQLAKRVVGGVTDPKASAAAR